MQLFILITFILNKHLEYFLSKKCFHQRESSNKFTRSKFDNFYVGQHTEFNEKKNTCTEYIVSEMKQLLRNPELNKFKANLKKETVDIKTLTFLCVLLLKYSGSRSK